MGALDPGVVEEHVDPTELREASRHVTPDRVFGRNIRFDAHKLAVGAESLAKPLQRVRVAVNADDAGTPRQHEPYRRRADFSTGAGHQRDLSFETVIIEHGPDSDRLLRRPNARQGPCEECNRC